MIVTRLELVDFRNYREASFDFHHGITAVVGLNGQGKTNLAEAMAYLATLDSFRGAPTDALIRVGAETAIVRATVLDTDGREQLVELELSRHGRNRVQERRRFLDDTLVSLALKYDAMRLELDRIVKQRNVLLKQAAGRLDGDAVLTLDIWDTKLAQVGDQFGHARAVLVARLTPMVQEAYEQLADRPSAVELRYEPEWRRVGLAAALEAARRDDVRRGVSTVGPHRDDLELFIGGLPARTHASQGEQRTLALALRLAAHRMVAEKAGSTPVLVLDDVLSELDPQRSTALLRHLPAGQVVLTTAGVLPEAAHPDVVVRIDAGAVVG
jgi:DNA replication and repair protein RecF